ncbi:MAG: Holliday junction branch migration protein RuvA, partial [Chitinivibrionia bacterium]|nr:Holliday junction branch migration protein RuvA [Chitinivibrionia bacterium]
MIASVQGRILAVRPRCIVEVGGIGLELHVPERDLDFLDEGMQDAAFHTYLHVREDRLALYGFLRRDDRELFLRLIDVSGIGPKMALGILSAKPAAQIVAAIRGEEIGSLVSIPGLGRKTAERLVMELKEKLDDIAAAGAEPEHPASIREEAILALTALGMTKVAAERAL